MNLRILPFNNGHRLAQPPSRIAADNLRARRKNLIGQFMPKHMTIDVELVTPENAKQYYFPDSVY